MYLGTHQQCVVQLSSGEQLVVRQFEGESSLTELAPVYASWLPQEGLMLSAAPIQRNIQKN
jgi:hypothetical protein